MKRCGESRVRVACRWSVPLLVATTLAIALPGSAAAQFSAEISPHPATLEAGGPTVAVTVSTHTTNFQNAITYSFIGFPAGIATGGSQTTTFPYAPLTFSFSAAPDVARGRHRGMLVGTASGSTQSFPMTVVVEGPDFALAASPTMTSLPAGGSMDVSVSVVPIDGFAGVVSVASPSLPGLTFAPSSFSLGPAASRTVTITADPAALPGTRAGIFRGTAQGVGGERTAPVTVQVTAAAPPPPPPPPADFSLSVNPPSLTLLAGQSGTLTVSASATAGLAGSIQVTASTPPALAVQPAAFALAPNGSQSIEVTALAATVGPVPVVFTGASAAVPGIRSATASVMVAAPQAAPVIDAITPPAVVTGTRGNVLRLTGRNFEPGAVIATSSPGITVTSARVLSTGTAEAVVAVRPDAAPGPYALELTNPDGGLATGGARLLVYPAGALSAPLAVTAVAIVTPRPWQIVAPDEAIRAKALLATSGMGTVVGTWNLDGVPFDRFTRVVSSGYPVEVRSSLPIPRSFTGEHRLELVIEHPQSLAPQSVPFFQAVESRTALRVLWPEAGVTVDPAARRFRWTLVPAASGYEVEIEPARAGRAVRRRVADTVWRPDAALLQYLGPGKQRFRVRAVYPGEVLGEPTPWVEFTLPGAGETSSFLAPFQGVSLAGGSSPIAPSADPAEATGTAGQLAITVMSTTTTIASEFEDPAPLTRLQLSTQTDVGNSAFDQQATADFSASQDLEDPWDAREESRHWLTHVGATQGAFREELALGFAPPSFFDQTEFLTVMSGGGAVQSTFGTPAGRVAYYRSLDLSANGGFGAFEPDIDAAAYEAADQAGKYLFRTLWLRVTDPAVEGYTAGGRGRGVGVIGVAHLKPYLRLLVEAANGEFEPGEGAFEEARDGRAFRLGLDGQAGSFGYALTVGRTGGGFVNPANRGFTPGGISDRTRAEVSLQKGIGQATLSGGYRHVRGGIPEASGDPETTEDGAAVQLTLPLARQIALDIGGNVVGQRGDALSDLGLPETDRTQLGADLSVSETVGPLSFTQAVTWQRFRDAVHPITDQTVTGLSLAANGGVTSYLSLSGTVSHTRSEAAPEIGTTDQLLVSLQPALTLARLWLALTPRTAWMRTSNDLADSEFRSDQYQLIARWSPPWLGALINFEVVSDWNRSWSHLTETPSFDRQTVLTLTLNWRADRSWESRAATTPHTQVASR